MKKVLAIMVVGAFFLGGCTADKNPDPIVLPSVDVLPSAAISEAPSKPSNTATAKPGEPKTTQPENPATVAPSPSAAVPPAIEFAQRWGKKYSSVPEYAILKTANVTCEAIDIAGIDYFTDPVAMGVITDAVTAAGMESKDALEFAQDAQQNYCSSRG